jgi:hypothetical protein
MKRLHFFLLAFTIFYVAVPNISGQSQRLAIPATSFSLPKRGTHSDVRAYCLDRHLRIGTPVDFTEVLAGDARVVHVGNRPLMTLREAIDGQFLKVRGAGLRDPNYSEVNGTQIRFLSTTDEPISINFTRTVALGENGSNQVEPNTLAAIRTFTSEEDFRTVQDQVWLKEIDETRLEALGFYGPGKTSRTRLATRNAVLAFQKEHGLPRTGILNPVTKRALAEAERKQIDGFEQLGFTASLDGTAVAHVSDNIRAFETFLDRATPPTGKLSDTLRLKLDNFRRDLGPAVSQALAAHSSRALPSDTTLLTNNSDIVTFERDNFVDRNGNPLDLTNVLVKTPQTIELLGIENGVLTRRASGEKALIELDSYLQASARIPMDSRTVTVRSGIYKPGGTIPLRIGDIKIELSPEEMQRFISGTRNSKIDAAIDRLTSSRSTKPRVLVFRSPFSQGRSENIQGVPVLSLYGYKEQEALALARAIDRDYGQKVDVFVGSDRTVAGANLRNIPKLNQGSQIGIYIDENFKYSTRIVEPIRKDLRDSQIQILEVGNGPAPDTRIYVFAGHRDVAYQQLILRLADEGHFRDGIIVQAVCGGTCDGAFNSLLISKSGARAVISHEPDINAQAVQDVLVKFAELMSKEGAPNGNYQDLWLKSVDEVERSADPALREDVRKLRRIVKQVSLSRYLGSLSNSE